MVVFVVGLVWVMIVLDILGGDVCWLVCVLMIFVGIMMVFNICYYSFKDINFCKSVLFFVIVVIVFGFVLVFYSFEMLLFGFFVFYGLFGYV